MRYLANNLTTELLFAGHKQLDQSWGRNLNKDFTCARLYCIHSGSGFLRIHDKRYELEARHFYLILPYCNLAYGCYNELDQYYVHFKARLFNSIELFPLIKCKYELEPANSSEIRKSLDLLIELQQKDGLASSLKANSLLLELLAMFIDDSQEQLPDGFLWKLERLQKVNDYIDRHLNRRLPVAELARVAGMNRTYFSTEFKKIYQVAPGEYVRRKQLDRARFLLLQSDRQIGDIADELGFCDCFHFSNVFKKNVGIPPKMFRDCRGDWEHKVPAP